MNLFLQCNGLENKIILITMNYLTDTFQYYIKHILNVIIITRTSTILDALATMHFGIAFSMRTFMLWPKV